MATRSKSLRNFEEGLLRENSINVIIQLMTMIMVIMSVIINTSLLSTSCQRAYEISSLVVK